MDFSLVLLNVVVFISVFHIELQFFDVINLHVGKVINIYIGKFNQIKKVRITNM